MTINYDLLSRVSELERRLKQIVVRGKVKEVNAKNQRVKVAYGDDLVTGWLSWKPIRTGKAIVWWCPEVGEGVTVISPGELSLGEVLPGSYYDDFPAPSDDPAVFHINFGDGSTIEHNRKTHKLDVVMKGDVSATVDGKTTLTAKGGALIVGDVVINGKLTVSKDILGGAEVFDKVASMSMDRLIYNGHTHTHGSSTTSPPAPNQ